MRYFFFHLVKNAYELVHEMCHISKMESSQCISTYVEVKLHALLTSILGGGER